MKWPTAVLRELGKALVPVLATALLDALTRERPAQGELPPGGSRPANDNPASTLSVS